MNVPRTLTAEQIKTAAAALAVDGARKAFVYDLWQIACPLTISLVEFKAWLLEEHLAGRIELSRWDLRETNLIALSEITYLNATFHQVTR